MDNFHLKNLEEAAKEAAAGRSEFTSVNRQLTLILNHMSQGLLFIDNSGSIVLFNAAAEKILDKKQNDVINRKFDDVFDSHGFGFTIKAILKGKECPGAHDLVYITPEDIPREEILEVEPTLVFKEEQSEVDGIIILIRNITELRRLEHIADVKSRLEELGELASTIGHEIRNPLGGIKGFASLLIKEIEEDPKKLKMITAIMQGVDDLNRILTKLLDYSHPPPLRLEDVDVKTLIQDVIEKMQTDENVKDRAIITCNVPKHSVTASLDGTHIRSALINLILNSMQAIKDQGTTTISLTETNRNIRIRIEDTGKGIEEKNMKKIFRPFFSTKSGGSGFGLAEVKKTIDAHHGKIEVASEVGKGTNITLTIPRNR